MSSPNELPLRDMADAILTGDELATLFRDYRACASRVQLQVKWGPGFVAPRTAPSLDEAEELVRSRQVRGLQVRYEFGGASWCDTLMPLPAGVRLVRIQSEPC